MGRLAGFKPRGLTFAVVAALLGTGNCYGPSLHDCTLRCSPDNACPNSQHCAQGYCVTGNRICSEDPADGHGGSNAGGGDDAGGEGGGGHDAEGGAGGVGGAGGEPALAGMGGSPVGGSNASGGMGNEAGNAGGGADAGSGGDVSGTPLEVLSVSPSDHATSVDRDAELVVTFSAPLQADALNAQSLKLVLNGSEVSGSIAVEGPVATFTPDEPLVLLGEYTSSLSAEIASIAGDHLASAYEWSFETRDGAWSTPGFVAAQYNASQTAVAIDDDENVIVVWWVNTPPLDMVASRYLAASDEWEPASPLEADDAGDARSPQVAMLGGGNALAVWRQSDGTRFNIWANRFVSGLDQWEGATLIETEDGGDAGPPQLAADGQGNAIAVWQQDDGTTTDIWANRYTLASGQWQGSAKIEIRSGAAESPVVALNARGDGLALWSQTDGARYSVWSNRFDAEAGDWTLASLVETDDSSDALGGAIALNDDGDAMAAFMRRDGLHYNVWASQFDPVLLEWRDAALLESDDSGHAFEPRLWLDWQGNALVTWQQGHESTSTLDSNRFVNGLGWGTAMPVETGPGTVTTSQLVMDGQGNALSTWSWSDVEQHFDGWANRFSAKAGGWQTAQPLENASGSVEGLSLAVNRRGVAVAFWAEGSGNMNNMHAALFR